MPKKKIRKTTRRISASHIETRSLTLVDERGKVRALLFCSGGEGGSIPHTNFELMDENSLPRVVIQIAGDSTVFQIRYKDQKGHLGFGTHGGPEGAGFDITDEHGQPRIMIMVPRPDCETIGPETRIYIADHDGRNATVTTSGVQASAARAASPDQSTAKLTPKSSAGRKKKPRP